MIENGTVLLVEDDPTDVFLLKRTFAKVQIAQELLVVNNGVEAIDFLTEASGSSPLENRSLPCLILLDLKLPLKSGLEVLHWMRERPLIKRIPVVVFTSSLDRGDVNGAYDNGASGYFLKPGSLVKMNELVVLWRDYWLNHNEPPQLTE